MFDCVKLTESISIVDKYGEPLRLRKGKKGCVLQPGEEKNSYVVEFQMGTGLKGSDFTAVELPDELLHLESAIGKRFEQAALAAS